MNYYDAARIRKKGFANLMTDKLTSGQGIVSSLRGTLSDRSKAKSMAFKEKFDPLNIAKFLTGGSNLAPAILGRLTGRSKEDIGYFTGKRKYERRSSGGGYWDRFNNPNMGGSRKATELLEKIVSFMEKYREDDIKEQDILDSYNELNEKMKYDNHNEVMNVFEEAIKNKRKAMKEMAKEAKKRQAQEKAKEKSEQTKPATKPATKPETKPETPKIDAADAAKKAKDAKDAADAAKKAKDAKDAADAAKKAKDAKDAADAAKKAKDAADAAKKAKDAADAADAAKKAKDAADAADAAKKAKDAADAAKKAKDAKDAADAKRIKDAADAKKTADTAKKQESIPPAPPTAAPAPPTVTPKPPVAKPAITEAAKTAAKVGVGVAGMSTISSAIGGAESGGNYNVSYGDSFDKKTGKMVNRAKDPKTNKPLNLKTPEEFSGKKLTEMTLEEVKAFGEYRSQNGAGAGAVGKYQFMPSTLFGRKNKKGVFVPGLVQQLKKPMSSLFDQTLQDELQNALRSQDVATLKRLGIPITPGYEYMAHYIGAGGAAAVFKSISNGEDKTVAQVMIDSGYSVGNNQELYKLRAIEFEKILQGRLEKKGNLTPHSEANAVGEKVNATSKQNADMKKDMSQPTQSVATMVNQNNITNKQRNITISSPPLEELNPRIGR